MTHSPKVLLRLFPLIATLAAPSLFAQSSQQGAKLVGTGALGLAGQGISVALSTDGNTAAVGAYGDNSGGQPFGDGAIWIWVRSGGTWSQQAKLSDPVLAGTLAEQGWSVALSADGNTLIVGEPADDVSVGSARVWVRTGTAWSLQAKLSGTDVVGGYAFQGFSVALSSDGNTALVGGVADGGGSAPVIGVGAAWVFTRSGTVWTQQGPKLVGSGAVGNSDQGVSVALSADGNTALVGGDGDANFTGAVWVWSRSGGAWTQQGPKLTGLPAFGTSGFGSAVGLSADGNTAVVGADDSIDGVGTLHPFTRSGGVWTPQGPRLIGADFAGLPRQGTTVALSGDGNTAIVGGYGDANFGAAWAFSRNGGAWSQQGSKVVGTGSVGAPAQGWRVAISGDGRTALVGGFNDDNAAGAAWVNVATVPSVTFPPASTGACSGDPVSFVSGAASWPPVSAQWQVSINGGTSFTDISGATSTTLTLTASAGVDGNEYRTVFTSALGTATTPAATLSLSTAPDITVQPGNQSVNPGQMATFTSAATGTPAPTVAWYVSIDGGLTAIPVPGAMSPTLSFAAASGQSGNLYFAIFTTDCASVRSDFASLSVTAPPTLPSVTTQPASLVVCPGQSGALSEFLQQGVKLVGSGATGSAAQGQAVALSGDGSTLLVGGVNDNSEVGAAWVFTRSGDGWTQQGEKLVGTGPGTVQGASVALSADGNTALIGGWGSGGGAWVWTRSEGVWTQQGSQLPQAGGVPNTQFGYAVSLSADGNTAAVSGNYDNGTVGAAWIFTRSAGVWTQQGPKLVGTGAVGNATQGTSVALSGDGNTLLVGGINDDVGAGAVWVWTRTGGTWTQQGAKLVGSGAAAGANQGTRVALSSDGNTALWGSFNDTAPGSAFVFTRSGAVWTQQGPALVGTGAFGNAHQGAGVALSGDGNAAIVGGFADTNLIGATWVFTRALGTWTQQGSKLVGGGSPLFGTFPPQQGTAVALSADGSTAAVGGPFDFNFITGGSTWIFAKNQASFTATADGSPLPSVQWQVSADGGASYTDIAGATNLGLAVTASPDSSGNKYRAVFTNTGGTATSNAATFTVNAPPVVTADPANQSLLPAQSASFSASASGSPEPSVHWQVSVRGGAFTDVPGATAGTLGFTAAANMDGNRYRAVFTNACGTSTSAAAVLHVIGNLSADPMAVDAHVATGDSSNHNGVLEPGETVSVAPAWTNNVASAQAATATASSLSGPAGPTYTLNDGAANYGTVASGATNDCFTATGDCYLMTVSGTRPAQHWDATFTEHLSLPEILNGWKLHVGESFPDVPTSEQFYKYIENLFHNGITGGCAGGNYCPDNPVTRAQMAIFLLKGEHGSGYVPPACSATVFGDEPCPGGLFVDWVNQLAAEGITGGCGGGNYCPTNTVTRGQMSAFLLKGQHGGSYVPPACSATVFTDVVCPGAQFVDFINQLATEQITGGCGSGKYCPTSPNTRGQMAVFLVKTFGLELYGP